MNATAPVFAAKTPNHYTVTARQIRALGLKCVFRCGHVFVWVPGSDLCWATSINGGAWMMCGDLGAAPWSRMEIPGHVPARLIERDCYCKSFPTTGCDFCQHIRDCDGEVCQ